MRTSPEAHARHRDYIREYKRERRRRADLPENTEYHDEGCDMHPACLSCPFEVYRHDMRHGKPSRVPLEVAEEIQTTRRRELAKKYGVSMRQISRMLARARGMEVGAR